ncbi:MAG: CTP synthase [Alphaproteobacteria bacterium]|uniref:CTP synthase n=1 Tax=Candidatus Scatocola faecipullorum TaxID=2840917 RepID=UPI000AF5E117
MTNTMNSQPKFIFITGGVVSSLGKGLASASLASLLQSRGFKVRLRKLDPYLNVDPGTMSPYQHGEVFVTDDGTEADLDLGHYERFSGVPAKKTDSITTGKIYQRVIDKERHGDYLGATIQVIPHVTNEIKDFILSDVTDEDFVLCEIGGTVGDIEGQPYLETIRQVAYDLGRDRAMFIHVTLLPFIPTAGELKTKPTQHSVKKLQEYGIQPDMLLCRTQMDIPQNEKRKIALFCNIREENVIAAKDAANIYQVPIAYSKEGMDTQVCKHFGIDCDKPADLSKWEKIVDIIAHPEGEVRVAVVGKYTQLLEAYKSLGEALSHGGIANRYKVKIKWIDSEDIEKDGAAAHLNDVSAVLVPGGFGSRGTEGKIKAIEYARENNLPFLGICFGMQMAVIETMRHLAGIKDANTTEIAGGSCTPVVGLMTEWDKEGAKQIRTKDGDLGGTMRLGAYESVLAPDSLVRRIYGCDRISERHRHRYEVNISYEPVLNKAGMRIVAKSPDGKLPEIVERPEHPWFVGVQFHPELKSKPFDPHPLFVSFIQAAIKKSRLL